MMILLSIVILFSIGLIVPIQYVESVFDSDNYTLEGTGFLISEKTVETSKISMDFIINDSVSGKTFQFQKGNLMFSGNEFKILDNFKARLLKDGNLFRFNGATDNGDIFVIFGKIVGESKNGLVYSVRGVVSDSEEKKSIVYSIKITNVSKFEEPQMIDEIVLMEKKEITMVTTHTNFREIKQTFQFQVRVYDAKTNPPPDFTLNQGVIEGAKVTVNILDSEGFVVKSFEGLTDERGYFTDNYRIPSNLRLGKYLVDMIAEFGESITSKQFDLFIFEQGSN